MSDSESAAQDLPPAVADERKALSEKKICKVIEWLKGTTRADGPLMSPVRYKGLVFFSKEDCNGFETPVILRDADVVAWRGKAKDYELKNVCDFADAMMATHPKSRHMEDDQLK